METLSQDEYKDKDKIFYTSTLNTWYTIRLEKDKQLLTLSVTALGVLITLLRTVGITRNSQAIFFSMSGVCFCSTIILILCSLEKSSIYLKQLLTNLPTNENTIIILDRFANTFFVFAMIAVLAIGADSMLNDLHQEKNMSQEQQKSQVQKMIVDLGNLQKDGMQGAASLKPQPPVTSHPTNNQSGSSTNKGDQTSNSQTK
jgi:hypothetical protein